MPRFNKDRYITDDSYEVPCRSFKGHINAEGLIRRHLEVLQDNGYVEWDDHATVTDMGERNIGLEHRMSFYTSPRRMIVVEGVGSNGEEIIFVKGIQSDGTSDSYIYIDGSRFSAHRMTESLKQSPEEMKRREDQRKWELRHRTWGRPTMEQFEIDEEKDWS